MLDNSFLSCGVCYQQYDSSERVPVTFPQCGHTICKFCSDYIMKSQQPRCPFDRAPCFSLQNGAFVEPQINNYALQLVENFIEFKECQHHNEPCKYYCLTECRMVCSDCLVTGNHQHHNVEKVQDIKKKLNRKVEALETCEKEWDNYIKANCDLLAKRNYEQRMIDDFFEEEERIIKRQKLDTKYIISASYDTEIDRIQSLFGDNSALQKTLNKKIEDCDINQPHLAQILDEDISDFISKYDTRRFEQSIYDYQNDLDSLRIEAQPLIMAQIKRPTDIKLPYFFSATEQNGLETNSFYVTPDLSLEGSTYNMTAPFTLKVENEKLTITLTANQNDDCIIDMEAIKNVKAVDVRLLSVWLSDEELIPLNYIFTQISHLKSITINCLSLKKGTITLEKTLETRLDDLFSVLFQQTHSLTEIKLFWLSKNGTEEALNLLSEKALSQAFPLENLEICIENAPVTFQNYENFMKKLSSFEETLQKLAFTVNLQHLEGAQTKPCPRLSQLKNLSFNVKCECCNTHLHGFDEKFWVDFLQPMKLLENVNFSYGLPSQDLESFVNIFQTISKVKTLNYVKIGVSYPPGLEEEGQDDFKKVIKAISQPLSEMKKRVRSILFGANCKEYREIIPFVMKNHIASL